MRILVFAALALAGLHFSTAPSSAASLRVSPVLIDLNAPTAASSVQIWNDAKRPINVQVRIFRWSQSNGVDTYTPATDVAVSPPISQLKPGGENMVRVVRTSKRPVRAEESYRLIVDELPNAAQQKSGTVKLVIRHSIPVFFSPPENKGADVAWNVQKKSGGYQVTLNNKGDKRMRVADLALQSKGGAAVAQHPGLVGYVLGKSSVSWFIPGTRNSQSGGPLTISAQSDTGPIHAQANVRGG
ncbi:fimbrial biogenesis chaperone [Brucella thiophenivorans]|uniref:Gram-negative pili assembly chaperone, N-terminal domain protein n=1 Tax=Brucella thiophenivorans TaxID=571255 RepID=A0A256FXD0_9HYPH|nr:molecular chaperone [Brucella thiophenivorans]OYR19400.1 gram-negative pili assembly chaperone, N-terminal domain protein [Brucella thiophenivorans]